MGAPTPAVIVTPFGTNATGITLPVPVPSQLPGNPGFASFDDGFPTDTTGPSGLPPRWQDVQGILYMITAYLQALTGGQFWSYNATWEAANGGYAAGAVVAMAAGGGFWLNTSAGNTNNPDTTAAATSGWVPLSAYGAATVTGLTGGAVTLTAVQAGAPLIILQGTLTSNLQLIFPTWLKRWTVVNQTTGAFTVTCKTASGSGVLAPQFTSGYTAVYGDGTNILLETMYGVGTFTGSLTGMTGSTLVGVTYYVNGNIATLYSVGNTGTSSANSMSMPGLPLAVQPANTQWCNCNVVDNGNGPLLGAAFVNGSTIFFHLAVVSGSNVSLNSVTFTASGLKGLPAEWSISYPIT